MTSTRRCKALNARGEPCASPAVGVSGYCYTHDPELAEAREKSQEHGRARQRRNASLAAIYGFATLRTTDGKNDLLDIAAQDTLALENTVPRNRALAGFVQISIKVDEYTTFKEDIAALKAAVFGTKEQPGSVYDQEIGELGDRFPLPGDQN